MLKAVVFDLDGVLADTEPLSKQAAMRAIAEFGLDTAGLNWNEFIGMSDKNIIQAIAKKQKKQVDVDAYVKKKDEIFCQLAQGRLQPFAGVRQFIDALRHAGIAIALASSGSVQKVGCSLKQLGLSFPVIVTGSDVHHSKPNPEIYLIAARKLGVKPAECLAIEDAVKGVASAKGAGMMVVAITTSFSKEELSEAELVIESFNELSIGHLRQLFV